MLLFLCFIIIIIMFLFLIPVVEEADASSFPSFLCFLFLSRDDRYHPSRQFLLLMIIRILSFLSFDPASFRSIPSSWTNSDDNRIIKRGRQGRGRVRWWWWGRIKRREEWQGMRRGRTNPLVMENTNHSLEICSSSFSLPTREEISKQEAHRYICLPSFFMLLAWHDINF